MKAAPREKRTAGKKTRQNARGVRSIRQSSHHQLISTSLSRAQTSTEAEPPRRSHCCGPAACKVAPRQHARLFRLRQTVAMALSCLGAAAEQSDPQCSTLEERRDLAFSRGKARPARSKGAAADYFISRRLLLDRYVRQLDINGRLRPSRCHFNRLFYGSARTDKNGFGPPHHHPQRRCCS